MLGSECRHNGRHHCCDDCWLLGWCFGLWLHLGYDGQTTIDHDWMRALDYWFDHHLRSSEHSDVDRRAYHQWSLCGYPVRAGTCLHQRVRAAYQAWSSGWSSAVGYHMGNLDPVLVSCLKLFDAMTQLTRNSVSYGASFVGGSNQNADNYSESVFRIP